VVGVVASESEGMEEDERMIEVIGKKRKEVEEGRGRAGCRSNGRIEEGRWSLRRCNGSKV